MSLLSGFFKESDTQLGVFYPKHYLIAVFPSLENAQRAVTKLRRAGFEEDEAIAVEGREIIQLAKEETGPGNFLMQTLSRFFATEQMSHDQDLHLAQQGAAFVAVYCPTEDNKNEAWITLEQEGPIAARYYASDGIEHLAGDFTTN
ncbi:MAG: hypothetical protein ACXWSR_22130 [Bdellovibrionota bacterium]